MCRNIKTLFNFDPVATEHEIHASALQYVRKISGYTKPSQANFAAHEAAVTEVVAATTKLLNSLSTSASPRNREIEIEKARARSAKRFASNGQ